MTNTNKKYQNSNLNIIRGIKEKLKTVSVNDVLQILGFSRQNLYKHLNEENADKANLIILNKIAQAIATVKQKKENTDKQFRQQIADRIK